MPGHVYALNQSFDEDPHHHLYINKDISSRILITEVNKLHVLVRIWFVDKKFIYPYDTRATLCLLLTYKVYVALVAYLHHQWQQTLTGMLLYIQLINQNLIKFLFYSKDEPFIFKASYNTKNNYSTLVWFYNSWYRESNNFSVHGTASIARKNVLSMNKNYSYLMVQWFNTCYGKMSLEMHIG